MKQCEVGHGAGMKQKMRACMAQGGVRDRRKGQTEAQHGPVQGQAPSPPGVRVAGPLELKWQGRWSESGRAAGVRVAGPLE